LETGRFNAEGVTSRRLFDGGKQERELAETDDVCGRRMAARWPNTARALRDLAKTYTELADREDAESEHWRDAR
jgi:hypothetical protein